MLNSFLPMEPQPTLEEEKDSGLGSRSLEGLRSPQAQELSLDCLRDGKGTSLAPGYPLAPGTSNLRTFGIPPYASWAPRGPEDEDLGIDGSNGSSLHSSLGF